MGHHRGHVSFQFFNQTNPIKFLAFETNDLLLLLVRNESSLLGVSFVAVALDFQVFLAQTLAQLQTPKSLKEVVVFEAQIEGTDKM